MIGINYTYYKIGRTKILKSYLLIFGYVYGILKSEKDLDEKNIAKIIKYIKKNGTRRNKYLLKRSDEQLFDSPLIKTLMILAYDYEIKEKFLGKRVYNDIFLNNRIMHIFESLYHIHYKQQIKRIIYTQSEEDGIGQQIPELFEDAHAEIKKFFEVILLLTQKAGYKHIYKQMSQAIKTYTVNVIFTTNNSSYTKIEDTTISLYLNNKKKTTLYHECTHVVQKIIRSTYNKPYKDFELILHNEGMANFFAYNLYHTIESKNLTFITINPIFSSKYDQFYKELVTNGGKSKEENYEIIYTRAKTLGYEYDEQIENLQDRFFKFFSLQQHNYLYPKELLYQIGYEKVLASFYKKNKIKHIVNLLLYKEYIF